MAKVSIDVALEALIGAAVSGLLSGCGEPAKTTDDAPREVRSFQVANLTVDKFEELCAERGGLTQTHVTCGGTNACRGLDYNSWDPTTVVEHTCRGFSKCMGLSCVDLPEDGGLSGKEIYEETCAKCHGGDEGAKDANNVYTVFFEPGGDAEEARANFLNTKEAVLVKKAAFGSIGYYEDGTPYANMPAYHEELSVAELRRVVDHLVKLDIVTEEAQVLGINAEIEPGDGE